MSTRLQDKMFQMISVDGELREGTVKRVYLDKGIMLGKYEGRKVAKPLYSHSPWKQQEVQHGKVSS